MGRARDETARSASSRSPTRVEASCRSTSARLTWPSCFAGRRVAAIEECFAGSPRAGSRTSRAHGSRSGGGTLALMGAADRGLGYAGTKSYAATADGALRRHVVLDARAETVAVLEANMLGQLRTGAASGVAAKHLARPAPRGSDDRLRLPGRTQVACIRAAVPSITQVVAYCRSEDASTRSAEVDAEAGESHRDAGEKDIVVTATTSRDPVLRGEWLEPGALVCAMGANGARKRELDNVVLERAAFVCCDSREQARLEAGDLIDPIGPECSTGSRCTSCRTWSPARWRALVGRRRRDLQVERARSVGHRRGGRSRRARSRGGRRRRGLGRCGRRRRGSRARCPRRPP